MSAMTVASQIHDYLSAFKLLHEELSGFRQFYSCQTALTKLIDTWLKEIDDGNIKSLILRFQESV